MQLTLKSPKIKVDSHKIVYLYDFNSFLSSQLYVKYNLKRYYCKGSIRNSMSRRIKKAGYNIVFLILITVNVGLSQHYLQREDAWVNATLSSMSLDQKVGQLFMVRAFSRGYVGEEKKISEYITQYHIGGICFFQGSPLEQVNLINNYQKKAKIPLFMGIDGEWGLGMRFPNETLSFPKQLMLGAIQDNRLIYEMGIEVAKQCKRAGININFAPSVDINNNPSNPVIYDRSFGESAQNVTSKGYMYMKAMEDEGIMACIKHFPGHGDTDVDSHEDLPVLNHSRERLESTEFFPFRRLTAYGASALMVGHLSIPSLDNRVNRPTTLSQNVIKNILRQEMGYNGLIFTDAMDMKGITKYYPNGIAEAEAFLAGNDVILLPEDLPKAIFTIKQYISEGKITEKRLDESVLRILRAKYKLGLSITPTNSSEGLSKYLLRNQAVAVKEKLTEAAITLISDKDDVIPIKSTNDVKLATLSFNKSIKTPFQDRVNDYIQAKHYQVMSQDLKNQYAQLLQTFTQFDRVVVAIHTSGKQSAYNTELTPEMIGFLNELNKKSNIIVVLFGSPYLLKRLGDLDNVLLCYDNSRMTQDIASQSLFGVNAITGKLPITVSDKWPLEYGINRNSLGRLGYAVPERVQMNSDTLMLIDSIMGEMVRLNAAPGGQVVIAKDGKIVFCKSYGKLSSDGYYVLQNTIYDVASLTKILATTIATMKLVDDRKININSPLRYYIPDLNGTNKANIKVEDVMSHQAGLQAGITFYNKTTSPRKAKSYNGIYYSTLLKENFTIPVADNMFMRTDYRDSLWQSIYASKLSGNNNYKYSDLGYYLMQKIVENESGKKLDEYTATNFYKPLGLRYTTFNPLGQHLASGIAPTEIDNYFRFQTLQGHVHDSGAAMMGGVSGHAGLFSNAHDVAVIMQMLLNKGSYGGIEFIKPKTVELFTSRNGKSTRRGLGFDMKDTNSSKVKNMSSLASNSTFGHTGFTGTAAFADPEYSLVYVFLANRTYPSANNQTFSNRNYRPNVQSIIYRAIAGYKPDLFL